MKTTKIRLMGAAVAAAGFAAAANAGVVGATHYFTHNSTLFTSVDGGPLSSVSLVDGGGNAAGNFSGLGFDPSGQLWGQADGAMYTIDFTTGLTTFQFDLEGGGNMISFDFRTNDGELELFGMVNGSNQLARFNPTDGTKLGGFDVINSGFPATAYDPDSERYFSVASSDRTLRFYDVDSDTTTGTTVGTGLGVPAWQLAGGAWYEGEMFLGYRRDGVVHFGNVDTTTGEFSENFTFEIANASAMGYAVAPTPGSAALLSLGGVLAMGRRRR